MALLLEHYEKIYRYCYCKLHSREQAEDITQEAFLHFYAAKKDILHENPLACLYVIAKNLIVDAYRRPDCEEITEDIAYVTESDVAFCVREAVNTLPENLREIILLRYISDLKIGEIAQALSISRFAVHRRIKEAEGLLKEKLNKEDFI